MDMISTDNISTDKSLIWQVLEGDCEVTFPVNTQSMILHIARDILILKKRCYDMHKTNFAEVR
jgi:hypothetical protein